VTRIRNLLRFGYCLAALLLLSACSQQGDGRLVWSECWFDVDVPGVAARCGWFSPGDSMGEEVVSLPVVVLSRQRGFLPGDPVVHLQGGPGAAAGLDVDRIEYWLHDFLSYDWPGDLVLYDQRGIGMARPVVFCPGWLQAMAERFSRPLGLRDELVQTLAAAGDCLEELNDAGIDISGLSTRRNVEDLAGLIDALGYESVRLWGVSYGTRVALQAAREMPGRISAMVLDSAYPPQFDALDWYGYLYGHALEAFTGACHDEPECLRISPDPAAHLEAMYMQLDETPIALQLFDGWTGFVNEFWLTGHRLLDAKFFGMYWDFEKVGTAMRWPPDNRGRQFVPLLEFYRGFMLDESFHEPVYWAVDCADLRPAGERNILSSGHAWIDRHVDQLLEFELCYLLDQPLEPAAWREPVESDIPTLFIAGRRDPVTPWIWSEEAVRHFSLGQFRVIDGLGHAVSGDRCVAGMIQRFFRDPFREAGEC